MATQAQPQTAGNFPKEITYKTLKERHVDYMADFWARCRALYAGGPKLLENKSLLTKIMPKHGQEDDAVYQERQKRAFYIPYAGSIIDKLVAELMNKPITFELEETTSSSSDGGVAGASNVEDGETQLPQYYSDLVKNCGKPGGIKCSLNQFARDQMFTALQCRTAWALVDLPKAPVGGYPNRAEQDKAGGLNAYICPIEPECVVDWEETEDGDLEWVLVQDLICKRVGIDKNRNLVTLRWRYFTQDAWAVYELEYDKTKKADGPSDNDKAKLVDSGNHSFGKVPVRRMQLPEGLWAMGKLEAMARAHMNQRNALSWGQLKALFPVPVLYAMSPVANDPVSEDLGRAQQRHGQGYMRVLAEKDKLEYFSPDAAPYQVAGADLNVIRDEMHRVLHSMAQSVDNSGAALQRSADSKSIDQAAAAVILRALGTFLREHLEELLNLVATGRKDNQAFAARGADNFDDVTLSSLVLDAVGLETVSIPSAHFQKKFKLKLAKLALGADATEDDLETIKEELEETHTQDALIAEHEANTMQQEATKATAEATAQDPQGIKAAKALGKTKPAPSKGKKPPKKK
jgi:hypothetical protein